jgi:hypothetical protein
MRIRGIEGCLGKAEQHGQNNVLCNCDSYVPYASRIAQAVVKWRGRYQLCPKKDAQCKKGRMFTPIVDGGVCQCKIVEGRPVPRPGAENQEHA